jgi:DNA-directed RNA polymerase subunit M/transcription elongation factor TFIIS
MADSEEKRNEVAHLYASMGDIELKDLADEAWSLTETGRELLRAELARRGLGFELDTTAPAALEVRPRNLVALRQFRDLPEALLAKSFLESAGVESFLIDETTIRMDWLWSNLLGGVKLCVNREDADAAAHILNQEIPEKFSVEGAEDFEQPRCPQCQSLDISFEESDKRVAYAGMLFVGFPIPLQRRRWKCQSCGYIWRSTDEESKQST